MAKTERLILRNPEADAPCTAFHPLRHTYASLQLARGVNVVQLSRALGHHSPNFTLDTYVHLLEGDEAPALGVTEVLEERPRAETVEAFTPRGIGHDPLFRIKHLHEPRQYCAHDGPLRPARARPRG